MLDPRIYRTGFVAVALAVIVLAFSLTISRGRSSTTLAPDAFNGQNALRDDERRSPAATRTAGRARPATTRSPPDVAQAAPPDPAASRVSTSLSKARTADGTRTLETVDRGRAPGCSPGSIVIVAHRDSLGSPADGRPVRHGGAARAGPRARRRDAAAHDRARLDQRLGGRSRRDRARAHARRAGRRRDRARRPRRRHGFASRSSCRGRTARSRAADAAQHASPRRSPRRPGCRPAAPSLGGQLAHLAFPLTLTEQGPFGAAVIPAVLLSVSGDAGPAAERADESPPGSRRSGRRCCSRSTRSTAARRSRAARAVPALDGKVIPAWAIRLLVLALILPVLGATIDGLARARRRGHSIARWPVWVLAGAVPFVLALVLVARARPTGLIDAAPPGPVGARSRAAARRRHRAAGVAGAA